MPAAIAGVRRRPSAVGKLARRPEVILRLLFNATSEKCLHVGQIGDPGAPAELLAVQGGDGTCQGSRLCQFHSAEETEQECSMVAVATSRRIHRFRKSIRGLMKRALPPWVDPTPARTIGNHH